MKKILSVIAAVLICVLIFCGCERSDTNGAQSGAQASTGGEPSVSESAAEVSGSEEQSQSEEKSPRFVAPPDENGKFAPIDGEVWTMYYGGMYSEPTIKDGDANLASFMDDMESVEKLKESYPQIDDWKIVFESDFYESGLGYDSEKKEFVKKDLPVRFVILSTEQGDGFDIVFASSKHWIDYDYNYDGKSGESYVVPYTEVLFNTCTADKSKIEGIDFSGAQVYRSWGFYTENIPYLLWLPNTSSVLIMESSDPSLIKFEGATEPVKLRRIDLAKYWSKAPDDKKPNIPESRKNDCFIISSEGKYNLALWYYSAADKTARTLEGFENAASISKVFVSDTCLEVLHLDKGIFRYYDFSDGADPTKCIWTLSGDGGGLLGGNVTAAVNYSSIMDKNNNDRLVILYAEDESNMFWIASYTLEDGVQSNFCLDLSAKGNIGSCNVRGGVAYFSYYPHHGKGKRINYAVDVRPDKEHKLQANAW